METLRVMVVDDEQGMRLGVKRVLRNFTIRVPDVNGDVGFELEEADNGADALAMLTSNPPQILLLDHRLPDTTGTEILGQLNLTEDSDLLVIMITAYASIETAVTAAKRGAYDFLAKPFTPDELKSTMRKAATRIVLQRKARALAEEKRQVRFQFTSVLAHELKSPLAAIDGYLHILKDKTLGGEIDPYLKMVDRSLVRLDGMRKLIFDLLDMTRIESGLKARNFEEFDIREIAEEVVETVGIAAEDRGIEIVIDAPDTVDMHGDRGEVQIVLSNLVSNAVKYNRDDGRVDIIMRREDGTVRIEVKDTGIGMTEEETAKLFHDFVRIKNAKTRAILGSGLGLSTTKKIAALYEGDVTVTSTPDVGSTFTATLRADMDVPQHEAGGADPTA